MTYNARLCEQLTYFFFYIYGYKFPIGFGLLLVLALYKSNPWKKKNKSYGRMVLGICHLRKNIITIKKFQGN
jgi:hypothetical protein